MATMFDVIELPVEGPRRLVKTFETYEKAEYIAGVLNHADPASFHDVRKREADEHGIDWNKVRRVERRLLN